jgi:hypothetical protein
MLEMETEILKHRAGLSPDQVAHNERKSAKPEPGSLPPLQVQTITVSIVFELKINYFLISKSINFLYLFTFV